MELWRDFGKVPNQGETIQKLLSYDIVDLVLMNSAHHRQCLDPSMDNEVKSGGSERLAKYKSDASKEGCTLDNPTLFFINHAFCGSIIHQELLKRRTDLAIVLRSFRPNLPMNIIEKIVEYEDEA
jgi:hypothetical protein